MPFVLEMKAFMGAILLPNLEHSLCSDLSFMLHLLKSDVFPSSAIFIPHWFIGLSTDKGVPAFPFPFLCPLLRQFMAHFLQSQTHNPLFSHSFWLSFLPANNCYTFSSLCRNQSYRWRYFAVITYSFSSWHLWVSDLEELSFTFFDLRLSFFSNAIGILPIQSWESKKGELWLRALNELLIVCKVTWSLPNPLRSFL